MFFGTASLFFERMSFSEIQVKREAILFFFGCSEVNSTRIITSGLANHRVPKALFTCVVYTNQHSILYKEMTCFMFGQSTNFQFSDLWVKVMTGLSWQPPLSWWKPPSFLMLVMLFSCLLIWIIYIWKAVRYLSKQGQPQPHFHSKARQLSPEL